ncbi:hypothetical protein DY000_02000480 [Brassica cretica]|uniref:Malic enzyme n=1 Tax=Brassica cretica TaxID=69181 RepID=A0ABQ7CE08_BRACR|nr:hypothetical protein DY000_02000480 [Brassica cretica]
MVGVTGAVRASSSGISPPMGNGLLPTEDEKASAHVKNLEILDSEFIVQEIRECINNLLWEMEKCFSGYSLMRDPRYNKGLAFTDKERDAHYLTGLLPPVVISQEVQERKLMHNLRQYTVPLQRYMALMDLQERNERLFYKLLIDNVEELLPVVYTPTVGEACQKYGSIFRKPQGLYISLNEKCCLPITIDVGTNNQKLLDDEFYIGLKQRRATGQEYADFLHEFMCAVKQNYGEKVLVQFEDFANHNAFDLLSKYMDSHLVFNDDIQGTASVVLAGLIAAQKVLGKSLADHTFLFLGAGENKKEPKSVETAEPMALNPQLMPNGMPVPFVNEMFVLVRDGVEFEVDKIPGGHGGHVKAKGVIYLSNIRMVFVATKPVDNFVAFDMPLLYIHAEKFNQPIFHCNNISGQVEPVVPENEHRALYSTHSFKILFKEGGCGTFVPLFLNLISSVRQYNRQMQQAAEAPRVDPLQAAQTPVDEMMRHAYVDPNDPTKIYLQQPSGESQLRRRAYHSSAAEH